MANNLSGFLIILLALAGIGCGSSNVVGYGRRCPVNTDPKIPTVIAVSSQGSQAQFPGGSQFIDYLMYNYSDRAHIIQEPLLSVGISTPSASRLQEIVDDICNEIVTGRHDVGVWAFSLGADSMAFISEGVKKKIGSTERMHILLIDPMILDDWFGRFLIEVHADLGMPIAKFLRQAAPYIKANRDHWLDLSGGKVFSLDFDLRFINVDRHYPWTGQSKVQCETLKIINARLDRELAELISLNDLKGRDGAPTNSTAK